MTDRVEKWKAEHAAGWSTHNIAAAAGVHQSTVWTALQRAGFDMSRVSVRESVRQFDEKIIEDYVNEIPLCLIAQQYDITLRVIAHIVAEYDLPPRRVRTRDNHMRMAGVSLGSIGPLLKALPEEDFHLLLEAAAARGKTIAEVLIEDWEAE